MEDARGENTWRNKLPIRAANRRRKKVVNAAGENEKEKESEREKKREREKETETETESVELVRRVSTTADKSPLVFLFFSSCL